MYTVVVARAAAKALAGLQPKLRTRISAAVQSLGNDPRPHGCTKLTGVELYRIRVGDYRVLYRVADTVRVVNVTSVGHRREIYRSKGR